MLESIFNSENAERVLIFLQVRETGYGTEIARFYDTNVFGIQKQLEKFELGGVLVNRKVGRTRLYQLNPSYAFLKELKALLQKAFTFYPQKVQDDLLMNRRRPRRAGKPL
jgi:hypothetical protein